MKKILREEDAVRSRTFTADEVIFRADDHAGTIFQVTDGTVRLFARDGSGRESLTQFVYPGQFFGDLAFSSKYRKYTAVAMNDVAVQEYDIKDVKEGMSSFTVDFIRSTTERMDKLIERSRRPAGLSEKLVAALLDIADKDGEKVPGGVLVKQRITHEMLAGLIGARRETVTLAMGKLKKAGAVPERGSWLFLCPDVLRKVIKGN